MSKISRRSMLGATLAAASATASVARSGRDSGERKESGVTVSNHSELPRGLYEAARFPLVDAIYGRRSRRFAKGTEIPGGPLRYKSKEAAQPLTEMQQLLLLTAVSGNTGWSNLIPYNPFYEPRIPNYLAAAGGRSFPSAAGFHTSDVFFTDDEGVYFFPTRDAHAAPSGQTGKTTDLEAYLSEHKAKIIKLADGRLNTPRSPQHMEPHNFWCANVPGSTLIIPVADLAQHHILNLCYLVQSGACIYDDLRNTAVPGMSQFRNLVDVDNPYPLSFVDQMSLTEVTVETSNACYAGALMLQALGLGGWSYGGINQLSVLGASGDPDVPGLGFSSVVDERWPLPNVTGLPGYFEGHCPPHFPDMRSAVEAVVERKFGTGGPYNPQTAGPYKDTGEARGAAEAHSSAFVDCVTAMADYIFDAYGKFPATVPSIFTMMYLQGHQLDTGFYDEYFKPGAYLRTHADHDRNWATDASR